MKMQKFVILKKKHLNVNMLNIKNMVKLKTTVTIQTNIEVLHTAYVI